MLAVAAGAAEAVALARGLGIDPQLFIDAIADGPLDSPYLRTKASAIMKGDFSPSFTAEMAAKDGHLIVAAADLAGIHVDVAAAAAERLRRAVELGHAQEDMAAGYFASFDDG